VHERATSNACIPHLCVTTTRGELHSRLCQSLGQSIHIVPCLMPCRYVQVRLFDALSLVWCGCPLGDVLLLSCARAHRIDSSKPFELRAAVDADGALTVTLSQRGVDAVIFDRRVAGNPQGAGLPDSALMGIAQSMGNLAMVASLWASEECAGRTPPLRWPYHLRWPDAGLMQA
jgi:hypothetical protein